MSLLKDLIPQTSESISSKLSEGTGSEEMVLEHYRFAVFELTRQNLLLRKQLAAAEDRLAGGDNASDSRRVFLTRDVCLSIFFFESKHAQEASVSGGFLDGWSLPVIMERIS